MTGRIDGGFTLVEVLVVVGIMAIMAAIAVPSLSGYRAYQATQAARASLQSVATGVKAYLGSVNNRPPTGGLVLCGPGSDWAGAALSTMPNTCDGTDTWTLVTLDDTVVYDAPNPIDGATVQGVVDAVGNYCVTITPPVGSPSYITSTAGPSSGTCETAGPDGGPWTPPVSPLDPPVTLPAAPTGLSVDDSGGILTITWDGSALGTYNITVDAIPGGGTPTPITVEGLTCVWPSTDCATPTGTLPAQPWQGSVRVTQTTENGTGPGAVMPLCATVDDSAVLTVTAC